MDRKRILVVLGILVIACSSFGVGYLVNAALTSRYTTIIQSGSGIEIASYIIFRDGSTYYAKNGSTGLIKMVFSPIRIRSIDFENISSLKVLNADINELNRSL